MAGKKRTAAAPVETAEVVASTIEEEIKEPEAGAETIAIACCLPHGLKFDDVPTGNGSTKTVVFPGINSALKGKKSGILALPGNALCVTILKSDWEAILKVHGREIAFIGRNGAMPCIYPVKDKKGFKAAASEIAEMKSGLEPADPEEANVTEKKPE